MTDSTEGHKNNKPAGAASVSAAAALSPWVPEPWWNWLLCPGRSLLPNVSWRYSGNEVGVEISLSLGWATGLLFMRTRPVDGSNPPASCVTLGNVFSRVVVWLLPGLDQVKPI